MADEGMTNVAERLRAAADLFERKNAEYGGDHAVYGRALAAMFPDGLHAATEAEFHRAFHVALLSMKLTRYARNINRGGHADSLDDLAVYAQMLAALDARGEANERAAANERVAANERAAANESIVAEAAKVLAEMDESAVVEAARVLADVVKDAGTAAQHAEGRATSNDDVPPDRLTATAVSSGTVQVGDTVVNTEQPARCSWEPRGTALDEMAKPRGLTRRKFYAAHRGLHPEGVWESDVSLRERIREYDTEHQSTNPEESARSEKWWAVAYAQDRIAEARGVIGLAALGAHSP